MKTLDEQRQLLFCVDGLRSKAQDSATQIQSLERQVAARFAELASARGDITFLEESITVAECQLVGAPSALVTVKGERDEYLRRLGAEEHQRVSLEALLCGLRIRLIDHTSLFYSVWGFLLQDMERYLDVYLRVVFAAVRSRTNGFRSATSNVVETHSATLHHDVSSILMLLDGRLAVFASEPLVMASSDPSGPGEAPPPSNCVVQR